MCVYSHCPSQSSEISLFPTKVRSSQTHVYGTAVISMAVDYDIIRQGLCLSYARRQLKLTVCEIKLVFTKLLGVVHMRRGNYCLIL